MGLFIKSKLFVNEERLWMDDYEAGLPKAVNKTISQRTL
jgi:hypothetical protein